MYEIKFISAKIRKNFKRIIREISPAGKIKLRKLLENNPYPSSSQGSSLNKVQKKRDVYIYPITGGDRIGYLVFEKPVKYIYIIFAGNHDEQKKFLKSRSK